MNKIGVIGIAVTVLLSSCCVPTGSITPRPTNTPRSVPTIQTFTPLASKTSAPVVAQTPIGAQAIIAVGEWFAIVSADYGIGRITVRFYPEKGESDKTSWTRYLVSSTELCGIIVLPESLTGICRQSTNAGGQLQFRVDENGILKLDPYIVTADAVNKVLEISKLPLQTDGSKFLGLANSNTTRVARVKLWPQNKVTITYADAK